MSRLSEKAIELAAQNKSTSVAAFFQQNRQFLGFGSRSRCILMALKELIDNSLDICNEVGILPEILIKIKKEENSLYSVEVQDNGVGIIADQVPAIFGKFLYGSKFHATKQNRGQQGIGAAAITLESLSTTGKPLEVTTRVEGSQLASHTFVTIDTVRNEPLVLGLDWVSVDFDHGTIVKAILDGTYISTGRHSISEWINTVSIVNPDASFCLIDPEGQKHTWTRVINEPRKASTQTKVHPNSLNYDKLKTLLSNYEGSIQNFLVEELHGISKNSVADILTSLEIVPDTHSVELSEFQINNLKNSLVSVKVKPSTQPLCLIESQKLLLALTERIPYKHTSVATSQVRSEDGNVFVVEGGFVYDKEGSFDQKIEVIRIANNVPLMFQPGACALTKLTAEFNWKNTGLNQTKGELPYAPAKLFLHLAAVKIKFTSESKDAVAENPQLVESVNEVLKSINLQFLKFRNKEKIFKKKAEKERIINVVIPSILKKVSQAVCLPEPPHDLVYCRVIDALLIRLRLVDGSLYMKFMNETKEKYVVEIIDNKSVVHNIEIAPELRVCYYQISDYENKSRIIISEKYEKVFFIKADKSIIQ